MSEEDYLAWEDDYIGESQSFGEKAGGFMYDYNSTLGKYLVDTKTNYWEILYNGTAVISS
jgi:hypothetical protein